MKIGNNKGVQILRYGSEKTYPELLEKDGFIFRQIQVSKFASAYVKFHKFNMNVVGFRLIYEDREDGDIKAIQYPISIGGYQLALKSCLDHFHNISYNRINPVHYEEFKKGFNI